MGNYYLHHGIKIRDSKFGPRDLPDLDGFFKVRKDWVLDRSTDRDWGARPVGWAIFQDDIEREISEREFVNIVESVEGRFVQCRLHDGLFLNYWIVKI